MRLHLHIGMRGPRLNAKDRQENLVINRKNPVLGGYSEFLHSIACSMLLHLYSYSFPYWVGFKAATLLTEARLQLRWGRDVEGGPKQEVILDVSDPFEVLLLWRTQGKGVSTDWSAGMTVARALLSVCCGHL